MPISSQVAKRTQLDILLEKNDRNRLRQDSLLKVQQVSSFDKRRFIKLIGRVDPQIMGATDVKIKQFLFGAEPVGNEPTSEMDDSGPATVESCSSEPTPAFPTGHDDQTCVMEGDDNGEGPHSEGTSV
ncbi:MAG: type II toxin-antitoxin system PemK/MazF family toxin [Armatimonadetes bacterium]|nr:type II toxin-antitoxin system PemK/MazF family toxin [Armatimonadota bacterium]